MPKVSVLIPSFNCAQYLPEALDSVLKQTFKDFEAIIIDDGSTDNTKEIVRKYVEREPEKIRYIYQENQGLACARNTGLRQARGSLIALLDADDLSLPQRLEETVRAIEADEEVGLVHANITRITEDGSVIGILKRNPRFLTGNIFNYIYLRKADISIPTILFRKECCERVGLFDENLARLGCEDRELWLRISRHYKFKYIDKVLGLYRVRSNSMSRNTEKMMEARIYVIEKFCSLYKDCQRLRKKALAKIYRDLGDQFLSEHEFNNSREQYAKAIVLNPISIWPWINYIKALLRLQTSKEF
ncbi:MAG: glycosyltransferase [Candidatus Omnitrophica bacterium]|nr:glycosyltransferase [Candidatus Omnitrophota bacterium]